MRSIAFVFLAACSSGSSKRDPGPAATPVERADDPWAVRATPGGKPGPAANNINKLVIGGDNTRPQMGLFALTPDAAKRVDAAMQQGYEGAYQLARQLAVKAWTGDRNFCEDAVRISIGYLGIDGMLDADARHKWKSAKLADVRARNWKAINGLHDKMIGEHDETACDHALAIYVEGLQLAATDNLELRNFGY